MPLGETNRIGIPVYGGAFTSDDGAAKPLVLPGELIASAIAGVFPVVLEASPDRIEPRCGHFGICGGCHYQHADYAAQLRIKVEILDGIFADAGLAGVPAIHTHTDVPWGYRNRIRLRIERSNDGMAVGYSRRATNEFLPVAECPIAAPLLWRAAQALVQLATKDANSARWLAATSEVELFCAGDESRLQITLFLREPSLDAGSFPGFCAKLQASIPELAGAGAELDPELNRRIRRRWEGVGWGAPGLNYVVDGRTYWVSRGAFFQVNRFLVERLVGLARSEPDGGLAWDLFAGVGLFTRVLAENFEHVVAVEAGEAAASDLAIAAKGGKGRPAFEAVHASTLDFLKAQELQRERPDLIVLDPPRAGLGIEAAEILSRIAAPKIVYVSCDPTTLSRDLAVLTEKVYRIESVHLIDLFPQTFHIETVVRLVRN